MNEQNRFGETDHDALAPDDILAQAIGQWREETPVARPVARRVRLRLDIAADDPAAPADRVYAAAAGDGRFPLDRRRVRPHLDRRATRSPAKQDIVVAQSEPNGLVEGDVQNANFADAQFNAAVSDLERILRDERDRLDPRTVLVIERNLKAIDDAIQEARMALNDDPANTYLNSHLADARRRKLELLRHATTLASAGGD